jgi:hypothetical protein
VLRAWRVCCVQLVLEDSSIEGGRSKSQQEG